MALGALGVTAALPARADDTVETYATQHPMPRYAVGYQRGTGVPGNLGASIALQAAPRVTPQVLVFALHSPNTWGVTLSPAIQLTVLDGYRNTPYVMAGFQLTQLWIGNGSGHGTGGFVSGGFAFRPGLGLSLELGLGAHLREHISAMDGIVTMKQAPVFSLHLDGGLRYWF